MRNNEEIISLIKSYLDNSSMSMSELASKSGVSKSTLSRYLSGSRVFPLNKAENLAQTAVVEQIAETSHIEQPQTVEQTPQVEQVNSNISVADELIKLKELLDAGVLTEEEFAAQKQRLLR